jgi:hypothetical protein
MVKKEFMIDINIGEAFAHHYSQGGRSRGKTQAIKDWRTAKGVDFDKIKVSCDFSDEPPVSAMQFYGSFVPVTVMPCTNIAETIQFEMVCE